MEKERKADAYVCVCIEGCPYYIYMSCEPSMIYYPCIDFFLAAFPFPLSPTRFYILDSSYASALFFSTLNPFSQWSYEKVVEGRISIPSLDMSLFSITCQLDIFTIY